MASDAAKEIEQALALDADPTRGKVVFELCATCHLDTGHGKKDGSFPVLAGQHSSVLIKQLADIQARNRENPTMYPFSDAETIGGVQAIADVTAYIHTLPGTQDNGKGDGEALALGDKLYAAQCAACHGKDGEGNADAFFPRLKGQHYAYLARQIRWMRDGFRKNGNAAMVELVKKLSDDEINALADSISRL
ncbi:unnamed protein product [Cyprideis torosa]|uniref:Uncharacterized protein n=1 Tax=Cyprideis torosa TaxID=163714 RepID=A0A7R8WV36_9CRUS|nr:unnamed protein product [Cyprideis torosa]CAG0907265.1 unnamed protein product [Cyprideis torosa]